MARVHDSAAINGPKDASPTPSDILKKADEIGAENIAQSEMLAIPQPGTAVIDPFFKEPIISVIADILDPVTKQEYPRDPSIDYKRRFEIDELRLRPHPYEFELYYDS